MLEKRMFCRSCWLVSGAERPCTKCSTRLATDPDAVIAVKWPDAEGKPSWVRVRPPPKNFNHPQYMPCTYYPDCTWGDKCIRAHGPPPEAEIAFWNEKAPLENAPEYNEEEFKRTYAQYSPLQILINFLYQAPRNWNAQRLTVEIAKYADRAYHYSDQVARILKEWSWDQSAKAFKEHLSLTDATNLAKELVAERNARGTTGSQTSSSSHSHGHTHGSHSHSTAEKSSSSAAASSSAANAAAPNSSANESGEETISFKVIRQRMRELLTKGEIHGGQILYQYRQRFGEPLSLKNCGKGYNKIKDLLLEMPDVVHIEQASGGHIVIRAPTDAELKALTAQGNQREAPDLPDQEDEGEEFPALPAGAVKRQVSAPVATVVHSAAVARSTSSVTPKEVERKWKHRAPPPEVADRKHFEKCKFYPTCRFGTKCLFAHGDEEFEEWNERSRLNRGVTSDTKTYMDWICPRQGCGNRNFGKRSQCHLCGDPKPENAEMRTVTSEGHTVVPEPPQPLELHEDVQRLLASGAYPADVFAHMKGGVTLALLPPSSASKVATPARVTGVPCGSSITWKILLTCTETIPLMRVGLVHPERAPWGLTTLVSETTTSAGKSYSVLASAPNQHKAHTQKVIIGPNPKDATQARAVEVCVTFESAVEGTFSQWVAFDFNNFLVGQELTVEVVRPLRTLGIQLVEAIRSSKHDAVSQLLEQGADVNTVVDGVPVLHWAIYNALPINIVQAILKAGASLSVADESGQTALHVAVTASRDDLVTLLLDHGASPAQRDADGWGPLAYAGANLQWSTVQILKNRGADINELDGDGYTILHRVCASGNTTLLQFILSLGASHLARDRFNRTPLDLAYEGHHYPVIEHLRSLSATATPTLPSPHLGHVVPDAFRGPSASPLIQPSILPSTSLPLSAPSPFSPYLLPAADNLSQSAFTTGSGLDMFGGSPFLPSSVLSTLDASEPSSGDGVHRGYGLNHAASSLWGPEQPVTTAFSDPWKMPFSVGDFSFGAAVTSNEFNSFGASKAPGVAPIAAPIAAPTSAPLAPAPVQSLLEPLVPALLPPPLEAEDNAKELFDLLKEDPKELIARIMSGEDPNSELDGVFLLHMAMKLGDVSVVQTLIENDASVFVEDSEGNTPCHYAAREGHSPCVAAIITLTPNNPEELLNARNAQGRTPLHLASLAARHEIAQFIISKGADVNAQDAEGNTPLHLALDSGANSRVMIQTLLNRRADANIANAAGRTPLHDAVLAGAALIVSQLLEHGVEVNKPTLEGDTALHLAARTSNEAIARLLLERGANANAVNGRGESVSEIADKAKASAILTLLERYQYSCQTCGKRRGDGNVKLSRCSVCTKVRYCSQACQLKDWENGHKNICRKPTA